MKTNCWEAKKCGREAGGANAATLGVCPASTDARLHRVHNGTNAGRACWIVANTLCEGRVQGSFGEKFKNCQQCSFYTQVKTEEGMRYVLSPMLMDRMRKTPAEGAR